MRGMWKINKNINNDKSQSIVLVPVKASLPPGSLVVLAHGGFRNLNKQDLSDFVTSLVFLFMMK